jgi:putative transposase
MARVHRSSLPDGYFHVVARSVKAAGLVFRDGEDRDLFLELTWRTARKHRWTCHAICVLGSHYHLVLETRRAELSSGLHRLNWLYAMFFNAKYESFGHVFAERFSARVIENDEHLYEACAYVLLNPVKAGLCEHVEDWPWSYCSFGLHAS